MFDTCERCIHREYCACFRPGGWCGNHRTTAIDTNRYLRWRAEQREKEAKTDGNNNHRRRIE